MSMNSYREWVEIYTLLSQLSAHRLHGKADFF
jgi:hypothetical protein